MSGHRETADAVTGTVDAIGSAGCNATGREHGEQHQRPSKTIVHDCSFPGAYDPYCRSSGNDQTQFAGAVPIVEEPKLHRKLQKMPMIAKIGATGMSS
jgi:hypothetical protein